MLWSKLSEEQKQKPGQQFHMNKADIINMTYYINLTTRPT